MNREPQRQGQAELRLAVLCATAVAARTLGLRTTPTRGGGEISGRSRTGGNGASCTRSSWPPLHGAES